MGKFPTSVFYFCESKTIATLVKIKYAYVFKEIKMVTNTLKNFDKY